MVGHAIHIKLDGRIEPRLLRCGLGATIAE